jgi:hypothetical protein
VGEMSTLSIRGTSGSVLHTPALVGRGPYSDGRGLQHSLTQGG